MVYCQFESTVGLSKALFHYKEEPSLWDLVYKTGVLSKGSCSAMLEKSLEK